MRTWFKCLMCLMLLGQARPSLAALPAVQAMGLRPTSNGFSVVLADEGQGKLSQFWPHLYAHRTPGETTPNLLYDAYFGLKVAGAPGAWAKSLPHPKPFAACSAAQPCVADDSQFGYVGSSGIVHDLRVQGSVTIDTMTFAPGGLALPSAVLLARVENMSAQPLAVDVGLLLNFHLGAGVPDPGSNGETLQLQDKKILVESGGSAWETAYVPIDGANAPLPWFETANPYDKFTQDGLGSWQSGLSQGDDRVGGIGWPISELQPGQPRWVGVLVVSVPKGALSPALAMAGLWLGARTAQQVLGDEQAQWQDWHKLDVLAPNVNAEEQLLAQRALTTLRMAQVREPDPPSPKDGDPRPFGQIVASLPPGIWHITWVRDQAYAGVALARAGHPQEAKAALDFLRHGQTGAYASYFGGPYLPSPVRYFGSGQEESDSNQDGPNVEFDGLGLCLWQAASYVQASKDLAWLQAAWPDLRDKAALVLQKLVEPTGLVAADSSIWEVHWNGKQKHFTYTSVLGVRGLCAAAEMATLVGDTALASNLRTTAQQVRAAVAAQLVGGDQILRGNLEEPAAQALDAAAVEAFLDGQFDVMGPTAQATLAAWQKGLSAGGGPGFFRNDDGGAYDAAEWLFIDLRIWRLAQRMLAGGLPVGGLQAALHQRVVDVARAGGGLLPELLATQGANAGQFDGAIPMVGFGAGALVLALADAAQDDDLTACLQASTAQPGDAGGGPADAGGVEVDALAADEGGDAAAVEPDAPGADIAADLDAEPDAALDVSDAFEVVDAAAAQDSAVLLDVAVDVGAPAAASRATAWGCTAGKGPGGLAPVLLLGWCSALAWSRRRSSRPG